MASKTQAKDRLHFLFWRKLNQEQRKSILVQVGMLTDDFEASLVWLRRGLDAARQQGKLHEIWTAMMAFFPDDQQEENPFQSTEKERIFVMFDDFEPAGFVCDLDGVLSYIRTELERMKDGEERQLEIRFEIRREDMTEERLASLPVQ